MKRTVVLLAVTLLGCSAGPSPSTAPTTVPSPARSTVPSLPGATASPSVAPSPAIAELERIELTGLGPIGIALAGETAWIVAPDSGHLVSVDLEAGRETAAYEIGFGGTHVVAGDGEVFVGRFDSGGSGEHLLVVQAENGETRGIETGPLGGLALAEDGRLWALEKAGAALLVDPVAGRVVDRVAVPVGQNEHVEAVAGAGAVWVGSDNVQVWRVAGDPLAVTAEIDPGGGIPLVFRDGLIWGARPDELWAIDPVSNEVSRRIPLTGLIEILALDIADDEAWIAVRKPGRVGYVVAVDLESGAVLAEHRVALPAGVAITDDAVWVTNAASNELVKLPR